ncbi:MAG: pectinesterase family protein [Paludibacteraceae bacterium]
MIGFKKSLVIAFFLVGIINTVSAQIEKKIVVDKSGNGDFVTLQEAVNAIRAFDPDGKTIILVKEGIYYEKVVIPEYVCNVKIQGEDKGKTIITYDDHAKKNNMGTFRTYTLQVRGNDVTLENLTIENNAERVAQAVALHTEGDRISIKNCKLLGNQDTFYANGENRHLYVENTYIEGTTDFIFGGATAWFENCDIFCKIKSYITAASTAQNVKYGFIFNKCRVVLADSVHFMCLGRPWRAYAMTAFINCVLPDGIIPQGWDNWRNPNNEKTARYFEGNNTGKGSETSNRVNWITILNKREIRKISRENVLGEFYKQLKNN